MLEAIYRLNRWYDDLDREHGVLRFLLFIIPMMIFQSMIYFGNYRVMLLGVIGMCLFAMLRIIPLARRR